MITLHDLLDNFCCTNPYTDYAIVNIKTGKVLVDRVHDRTYAIDDVDDYNKFLPYARKQVQAVVARIPPHSCGGRNCHTLLSVAKLVY